MAAGAGGRGAGELAVFVAGCATQATVPPTERETGLIVAEGGGFPGAGGVAELAVVAVCAAVGIIIAMAGCTHAGGALEDVVDMAVQARDGLVRAGKGEGEDVVVNCGIFPFGWIVTGSAVCAVFAVVFIIFLVAGEAVDGCADELVRDGVALFTGYADVFAFQLEVDGQVVVKFDVFLPTCGDVAFVAAGAEALFVWIIFFVAGNAIGGRADEQVVGGVAFIAGDAGMFAFQLEVGSQLVVECDGFFPAVGVVAGGAFEAGAAGVRVIFLMAVLAVGGG